ncbi:MAG TPA: sulfotransferase [Verrucomicrobiae bacterium]|nr:sulfotransferase [Verrucomicrobiae bacterium]
MGDQEVLDQIHDPAADAPRAAARPIFILGIAARCGTNYLHDLVRMHPECDSGSSVLEEDNLVANAHVLARYLDGVARWWKQHWGSEELQAERAALAQQMGQGLIGFLSTQLEKRKELAGKETTNGRPLRLVTKTPTVKNLGLFFELFPGSPLVVLVRDGRSVVESAVRTFDRPYGHAAREWASSAQIIQNHRANHPEKQFLLVRYEDLYGNVEKELRRIFEYLQLDPDAYDYAKAANLPVRGSSTLRGQPTSHDVPWVANGIHWDPVQKPTNFNPVERWANWNRAKHERFNWLAGDDLEKFGYERKNFLRGQVFWVFWNVVLDVTHVDGALWLARRVRRKWREINSVHDFLATLRLVKRSIVDALWERSEFGM